MEEINRVLEKAKQAAIEYYKLTGKPLGITGEVGEFEAARLLDLDLAEARTPGYDARDRSGRRYKIVSRAFSGTNSGRIGAIRLKHEWEAVALVLMDRNFQVQEIWRANRDSVTDALSAPGSKARTERGQLSVSQFRSISQRIWPS